MSITINGTTGLSGVDGSAGTPALQGSDPNTGIYSPGANQVAVSTNGVGRLFVDANGNVGVGAAANANGVLRLNVSSGNNANLVFSENNTDRYILGQVTGDNALRVYDLVTASERLRITSDAYVRLASGSGGIQFNGDTAAVNALDDYEEGTWTATFAGSSDTATGYYTKIGRLVHIHLYSANINVTSSVGAVVSGLPFTIRNQYSTGAANHNTYSTNGDNFFFDTNSTQMIFYQQNTISQATTNAGNPRYVMMSGSYSTDT